MKRSVLAGLAAGVATSAHGVYLRYRREMSAARARLAAADRDVISARWGAVEYAERGSGDPVLVIHGIYHHCVGGLLSVRDLFLDRRVIAPSRFGYLGSSMPPPRASTSTSSYPTQTSPTMTSRPSAFPP